MLNDEWWNKKIKDKKITIKRLRISFEKTNWEDKLKFRIEWKNLANESKIKIKNQENEDQI